MLKRPITAAGQLEPKSLGEALASLLKFSREELAAPADSSSTGPGVDSLPLAPGVRGVEPLATTATGAAGASGAASTASLGHLHYGGMPAKTPYGIGCKPEASTTFKKQRRHELIARMENAALPEPQIAALLSISVPRLRSIKQHPDYLKARMKVTLGLIVDQEASLAQIREQRKEFLIQNLPAALQVIANAVSTPAIGLAERKLQLFAAQDLLDREGTFAKISRSEVKPVEHFNWETTDTSAAQALDVVKSTLRLKQTQPLESLSEAAYHQGATDSQHQHDTGAIYAPSGKAEIEKIIEITRRFKNGRSPSLVDQQAALEHLEKEG